MPSQKIVIGTRGSKLALVQARFIAAELGRHYPDMQLEERIISTKGDRILDVALSAVGDKGLFVKEIEVALANGEIDLAVHSGKDLPSITPDELALVAFPKRVDPRDALVLPDGKSADGVSPDDPLSVLPKGARLGTSSLRRACQIRALRPDLEVLDVRGNVDTRLRKLDEGEFDAIALAAAGLTRLGMSERISVPLSTDVVLPAVAQGALILEARVADQATLEKVAVLDDAESRAAVFAERAFLRRLEGGCQVPIAAHAVCGEGDSITLRGLVGSLDGTKIIRGEKTGTRREAADLGLALAEELLERGAAPILDEIQAHL